METITLTFGDCAENHHGMQEIGEKAQAGLTLAELTIAKAYFEERGVECELIDLSTFYKAATQPAYLLIARNGCGVIVDPDELVAEQAVLERDKKAFMRGRVVNKRARYNLCFSDFDQEPDYENKKGRIVNFAKLPLLSNIRAALPDITTGDPSLRDITTGDPSLRDITCGDKLSNLQCEANYYYDIKSTYIGFHGDTERKIVVAVRLGADFPIHFQWFLETKPVGEMFTSVLKHGDVYFMSEKAVGFDWKRRKIPTLRHAAGSKKNVVSW